MNLAPLTTRLGLSITLLALSPLGCSSGDERPARLGDWLPDGSTGGGTITGSGTDGGSATACSRGTYDDDFSAFSKTDLNVLAGYTEITGELYIGTNITHQTNTVTDVNALSCVTKLGGLVLLETPIENLDGLSNLRDVGLVDITNTMNLESLAGFEQLSINGNMRIGVNFSLVDFGTSSDIVALSGQLDVWDNVGLDPCVVADFANRLGATCSCTLPTDCP